jgi:hypothetical protein
MLLSVTVALLAAAPGHVSLLAPEAPTRPVAARLLAQADSLTAPPLPSSEPHAAGPELPELEARIQDMSLRLKALNGRIHAVDTEWPGPSILMTGLGGAMVGTIALLPLVLGGLDRPFEEGMLIPTIVAASVGTGLMVAGVMTAQQVTMPAQAEREKLLRERTSLKQELQKLKVRRELLQERGGMSRRRGIQVPLASLAF